MLVQKGFVIWLTGMPLSGKTTLAEIVEGELLEIGLKVELFDEGKGDFADSFIKNSGNSCNEKNEIAEKLGLISKILTRNEIIVIVASTSPAKNIRNKIRSNFSNFLEVFVNCSIDICKERDINSIYSGSDLYKNYEIPDRAEVIVNTDKESEEESVKLIIKTLEMLDWIPKVYGEDYSSEEEAKIHERLESLGYL
ncbi:MAG: adenylyl-sulfate kinase [Cyanobacteriota bacterium]